MGLASREIATYLDFHSSEQMWLTLGRWALGNFAAVMIALLQSLEGLFTNSGEFMDLQVRETLEGHRQGHLLIRKTYILLFCAFLCFFMLFHAFSCFSVKAREKYNKSNPPYFSECLGIWLKK